MPSNDKGQPELRYWKSTHRMLFALALVGSALLCLRVVYPLVLNVSWQGSDLEEIIFVFLMWLFSSLIVGSSFIAVTLFLIAKTLNKMAKERDDGLDNAGFDRPAVARSIFSSSLPRWLMSLSCFGPPIALAMMAPFYREQLPFDDALDTAKACSLLGLIFFVLSLPLTIRGQRSLHARVKEKFPDVDLDVELSRKDDSHDDKSGKDD